MRLYDFKWVLVIFLAGALVRITGALFKLRHWPMADELLTIGTILCGIGILMGIVKIAVLKKPAR